MTASEFASVRTKLGLTMTQIARVLGVSRRQVYRYEDGEMAGEIPEPVARLLHMYAQHGIPKNWKPKPS